MTCLLRKIEMLTLLLLSAGGALAASMNTTALNTNTTTATVSQNSTALLIDGRCNWSYDHGNWECPRKGFQCINLVCVDMRTPEQKEADKQEDADGKDGRCLFTYETANYTCTQRGFERLDQNVCVDHRAPKEIAEDAEIQATKDAEKRKDNLQKAKWSIFRGCDRGRDLLCRCHPGNYSAL